MNLTQMKYFITAAKCLNFTQAADKLFITQPALSRQIAAMETELNMQLFVRGSHSLKLTPPGSVLLEEFERIYDDYNLALAKAANSFAGMSGELNIGILEGAYVGDLFPGVLRYFDKFYSNVKINLRTYSFNALSEKSPRPIIDACKNDGFYPKVKFASSLQEEMLWVEAGVGVCILDTRNSLYKNTSVRFLDVDMISDPSLTLAWNTDNYNPLREIFIDNFTLH